jgi:glycosyltransferase involved in cell wall biosynthesis
MNSLSIIIPAFNEEENLKVSVTEVIKAAETKIIDFEIIIIDDGSSDNTFSIAKDLEKDFCQVKVVRNNTNLGLGGSYKKGVENSSKKFITWVPADNSHPAKSLKEAYASIGIADMVIPVPTNPEVRGITRRVISKLFTSMVNLLTNNQIIYYNGLTIHKRELLDLINIETNSFAYQSEIIVKLLSLGASHVFVDTTISDRKEGASSAFRLSNIIAVVKFIVICSQYRRDKRSRE